MEIVSLILGTFFGWVISHVYYLKSNKDQNAVYNKLEDSVRDIIRSDQREKLSVKELNELLDDRVMDPEDSSPFPYKVCPKCGNEDLKRTSHDDYEREETYYVIGCTECGWSDWSE